MRWLLYFIAANKRLVTLGMAILLSFALFIMGDGAKQRFARTVATSVFTTGRITFAPGIYMLDLWRENKRLRLQNLDYSYRINEHRLAVREADRLRALLGFKERRRFTVIPANVIGQDVDRVVNALIVDVGKHDGVRKHMAVVTAEGLVGRVHEVFPSSASVQIIRDANSRISAMIGTDRARQGFIRWEGGDNLRLYLIQHVSMLESGEVVYTTGAGGTFPAGLVIGTVVDRKAGEHEVSDNVAVKPAVDFGQAQEVFILAGTERADIWNDGDSTGVFNRPDIQ